MKTIKKIFILCMSLFLGLNFCAGTVFGGKVKSGDDDLAVVKPIAVRPNKNKIRRSPVMDLSCLKGMNDYYLNASDAVKNSSESPFFDDNWEEPWPLDIISFILRNITPSENME